VGALTCGLAVGKSRDALYENVLAENEREAVADLLQYLENVSTTTDRASISVVRHR
jgi:vacuolar protein 8